MSKKPISPALASARAQATPDASADGQPTWVATTPLRFGGQRIEAGQTVPGLSAQQAAELGSLVEPGPLKP